MLLSTKAWSIEELAAEMRNRSELVFSDECRKKVADCRDYLDRKLEESDAPIYGVNTGFGSLYNQSISEENLTKLQVNLIRSHACGMGGLVPKKVARLMLLLKAKGLSLGHSAAQVETVERLVEMYNRNLVPVIYQQGSLGASGDLAPLAHLALTLLGEGEIWVGDERRPAGEVLAKEGLAPIELKSKEGLALLNGTQFMSAYALHCVVEGQRLMDWADTIGALSLEAYDGRPEPFIHEVHAIRNHPGQIETAARFRKLFEGSELISRPKKHVQDPYSFRCIPQVHGASKDAIKHITKVVEDEINAVTDNPTIFPEQDLVVSAGNFHGQPLAISLDQLAIAIAEIGSISERRVYKLISGQRELPAFLVSNPGLNSGMMIPQYTAASIVSQNKSLCTPSSVDTIDSSNGQEDHVSMGANAATKTRRVVDNVRRILAVELLNATQAIEFRRPAKCSSALESLIANYRKEVPFIAEDEFLSPHMKAGEVFLLDNVAEDYLK